MGGSRSAGLVGDESGHHFGCTRVTGGGCSCGVTIVCKKGFGQSDASNSLSACMLDEETHFAKSLQHVQVLMQPTREPLRCHEIIATVARQASGIQRPKLIYDPYI